MLQLAINLILLNFN